MFILLWMETKFNLYLIMFDDIELVFEKHRSHTEGTCTYIMVKRLWQIKNSSKFES